MSLDIAAIIQERASDTWYFISVQFDPFLRWSFFDGVVLELIPRVLDISITIRVFLLYEVHAYFVMTLTAGQRLPTSCVVYSYAILMFFNHCKLGVFSPRIMASSFKLYNK